MNQQLSQNLTLGDHGERCEPQVPPKAPKKVPGHPKWSPRSLKMSPKRTSNHQYTLFKMTFARFEVATMSFKRTSKEPQITSTHYLQWLLLVFTLLLWASKEPQITSIHYLQWLLLVLWLPLGPSNEPQRNLNSPIHTICDDFCTFWGCATRGF